MLAAAAVWAGALLGGSGAAVPVLAGCLGGAALVGRRRGDAAMLLVLVAIGVGSGSLAGARIDAVHQSELPAGRVTVVGTAASDPMPYGGGVRLILRPSGLGSPADVQAWQGPPIAVVAESASAAAGDRLLVVGLMRAGAGSIRGDPVAGTMTNASVERLSGPDSLFGMAGNAVRNRVSTRLSALTEGSARALLAGFLIGDTDGLRESDINALRRAGLTHFVAVSGSNVALVLGAWWLVLGPAGVRTRAATGLVVLVVYVVATRWESSVIRAATMAALVLGGKAAGVPLDAWTALGAAVAMLLAVSGDLAFDIGFQLSVAATAGVLVGLRLWHDRRPRFVWSVLAVTVSAQLAVAPLLLAHFGSIPLLSPVANMVAAPLVTAATAAAGLGVVLPWDAPLRLATLLAELVLEIARVASSWPQLNATQTVGLVALAGLTWRTRMRAAALATVAGIVLVSVIPPGPPAVPTVVFLDVGQGDAVLLRDPGGSVVLVDGGREPAVLQDALRRHGIGRADLLVATHGDADHVGGLVDRQFEVGEMWIPRHAATGEILEGVVAEAQSEGVVVRTVAAGDRATLGEFSLEVIAPLRRYATDNDGSVVLLATVGDLRVLLPGDIGEVAQRELGAIQADLLMVPHHGAGTSDFEWLAASVQDVAVISVGPNTYGHPAAEVVAVLEEAGASVLTTWNSGDVVVPLR